MLKRFGIAVLIAAIAGAYTFSRANDRPELIPFGDSITDGTFNYGSVSLGYRQSLQDELGIGTYRLRGQFQSGRRFKYQRAHSGVIGETNQQISARLRENLKLYRRLSPSRRGVMLIHAGTNDLSHSQEMSLLEIDRSVGVLAHMITTIREYSNDIDIYVALLIPSAGEPRDTNITRYNDRVSRMLVVQNDPHVYSVDMNAAFKKDTFGICGGDWRRNCLADRIHPSYRGYAVMGKQWAACMKNPAATNCNGH